MALDKMCSGEGLQTIIDNEEFIGKLNLGE